MNLNNRFKIYNLLKNKNYNGCVKLYNNNLKIGTNIILEKRIGSNSKNANVFMSYFMDNKKIKIACKITPLTERTIKDVKIQENLMKIIKKCPHFPIIYNSFICDYNIDRNRIIKEDIHKFPFIIKKANNNKDKLIITFNELADGDLRMFINNSIIIEKEVLNILIQVYLSLIFYYKYVGLFHYDTKPDNFLYHRINKGGYFHYKIFGKDYYLENVGLLCIIWDFEVSKEFGEDLIIRDFADVIRGFLPKKEVIKGEKKIGYNKNPEYCNKINMINKIENIYNYLFIKNTYSMDIKELPNLINKILEIFVFYGILKTSIRNNTKIINKYPYII